MWVRKRSEAAKAVTVINEGCQLEGRASLTGVTLVNGRFTGSQMTAETLIVGREAVIACPIQAQRVTVFGRVVGDITGREQVKVEAGAHVIGDIDAPVLVLKNGAVFDGHCRTSGKPVLPAVASSLDPRRAEPEAASSPPR